MFSDITTIFYPHNFLVLPKLLESFFTLFLSRYPSQWREITIDPQVQTIDGVRYDVVFVGTDKGQVLKIVNLNQNTDAVNTAQSPIMIEELQVLKFGDPVLNLMISQGHGNTDKSLLVTSSSQILSLPLQRCQV